MSLTVEINGTSQYTTGLVITKAITHTPDFAYFILPNPTAAPAAGQTVSIYRSDASTDVLFGGTIYSIRKMTSGKSQTSSSRTYSYAIQAEDYQRQLDRYLVNNSYTDDTCATIIGDFVTNYTDPAIGYTTTNVSTGPIIEEINFIYTPVSQCIQDLATISGYDWYVDENKDIHFFEKETISAPFDIDETAVKTYIDNLQVNPNYSQTRNRIYVRGGYYLSPAVYEENIECDGTERIWKTAYKPHTLSNVQLDAVAKTSAVDHVNADDGTYQFFWNYHDQYIRCADNVGTQATPANGVVLTFDYYYEIPVIVRADNTASQTTIAALEGGTGIYEAVIYDDTLETREQAKVRALVEVDTYGDATIKGSFVTHEHLFKPGQYIKLDVDGFEDWDGNYQIQEIRIEPVTADDVRYTVTFASTLYRLKDLMLGLIRNQKRKKMRPDETVDVLKVVDETVTAGDGTLTITAGIPTVKWDTFTWNHAMWG